MCKQQPITHPQSTQRSSYRSAVILPLGVSVSGHPTAQRSPHRLKNKTTKNKNKNKNKKKNKNKNKNKNLFILFNEDTAVCSCAKLFGCED